MTTYDIVGIGNAVVDVITQCDDAFLGTHGIEKAIMQLVEQDRAEALYDAMAGRVQTPGGAVANTIAGAGALGLKAAFIGRVRDDALGRFYASAMTDDGVAFVNPPVADGKRPTSRSMIFVTPDGERSMNTYLGISTGLSSADVPNDVSGNAKLMFLEGYLFDHDAGKSAFRESDFLSLIEHDLDYVMGNEAEIKSLWETDDLDAALTKTAAICDLVVCTRSGDGVTMIQNGTRVDVPVTPITPVDATGAGDQFAAGFLYGLSTGRDLETCGRMGNICAAEVISHIGPRPATDVMALFKAEGLA